jgi:hypothetical protein
VDINALYFFALGIGITSYLSSLSHPDIITSKIEQPAFPLLDDESTQQLPEDFLLRG